MPRENFSGQWHAPHPRTRSGSHSDASHASQNPRVRGSAPIANLAEFKRANPINSAEVLHRNPLHDIPSHSAFAAVIEARRSWVRVPCQVLHILKWNALLQQIRDRCYPK